MGVVTMLEIGKKKERRKISNAISQK